MNVGKYVVSEAQKEHMEECVKLFNEDILPKIDDITKEVDIPLNSAVKVEWCCAWNVPSDIGRAGIVLHAEPKYCLVLLQGDDFLSAFRNEDLSVLVEDVEVFQH